MAIPGSIEPSSPDSKRIQAEHAQATALQEIVSQIKQTNGLLTEIARALKDLVDNARK